MPIYEYRCEGCGHMLDALQKVSDAPLKECPSCNESRLKRLISAPSFRLRGGGWYETDFKSDKERRRNLAESGDKGDKGDKGDQKKEAGDSKTKPETKSDTKSEPKKPAAEGKSKSKGSGTEAA